MAGKEQAVQGLDWRDGGVPVSRRFDDPYFSLAGGLEEARHVFLAGNGLPERFSAGFHIAELGFGTGLNLLATHLAKPGVTLSYTSFEAFPLDASEIAKALTAFPEAMLVAGAFLQAWDLGLRRFDLGQIAVEVIVGDARDTLPIWQGKADAWFLDGFSPAKNPELWSDDLMREVGLHTSAGGTFATYTAAGHVRRGLAAAGFTVERQTGFARKRHMSVGHRP